MRHEYTVRVFTMEELEKENVIINREKNIVYACQSGGGCEVHDVTADQLANLSGLFNRFGEEGWELVNLFFRSFGIVSFWKRTVTRKRR